MEPDYLHVSGGEEEDWSRSCTPESTVSAGIPLEELYSEGEEEEEDLDAEMGHTIANDLETLTETGTSVNKLEIALLEARKEYESCKKNSQVKLIQLKTRLKSSIEKTEPFVAAWRKAREYQQQAHDAAMAYERSYSEYESAKETLRIAERSIAELREEKEQSQITGHDKGEGEEGEEREGEREEDSGRKSSAVAIDEAWQETLANATLRVEKANQKKIESGIQHKRITVEYQKVQADCKNLENKLKRSIKKSKPYYEERFSCNQKLVGIKKKIQMLQQNIDEQKIVYKRTMKHLESLSGLMHEERVRRRTNSSLDITSSEPNLLTKRTLTPDPSPAPHNDSAYRMAATPDTYRKKEWASTNVRIIPPFPNRGGGVPVISANHLTANTSTLSNTNSSNVRDAVTDCLTRALGSSPSPPPPSLSTSNDDKPLNCTVTISVSHESNPLSSLPLYPTTIARQLVENVLDNALLQVNDDNELSNSNHGNITLSNGSHDNKDKPTDH